MSFASPLKLLGLRHNGGGVGRYSDLFLVAGVAAIQIGASRRYDGPMGKSDRAFWFGALALLLGLGLHAGVWTTLALLAIAAMLCKTIYNRTRRALDEAGAGPQV